MKKINFLFLLICIPLLANAQSPHMLFGTVVNSLTHKTILGAKIQRLAADSSVVDSMILQEGLECSPYNPAWRLRIDKNDTYLLRFSADGYETQYKTVKTNLGKREMGFDCGKILLKRTPQTHKLGDAVVKATRVKFFHKGDTIVYNADAFQLAEGSMLDALIGQLPGVELKDDGRIFVNGKFVENLLLNGKEFFRNDRTIMLDNLPSYMVNNVKVYEKTSELSEFLGRKDIPKSLTMDVVLKRQYSIGWIANAEAGLGSEDRYMARIFALRFSPQSRVALFANLNNLNDSRRPGKNGEWSPADLGSGLTASKKVGLDYNIENKYNFNKFSGSATLEHSDADNQSTTNGVNFLTDGNTYNRSRSSALSCNTSFNTDHRLSLRVGKTFMGFITPTFNYNNYRGRDAYLSADFIEDPSKWITGRLLDSIFAPNAGSTLQNIMINRNIRASKNSGHSLRTSVKAFSWIKMPRSSDNLSVELYGDYDDSENRLFSHNRLEYPSTAMPTDFRNQYATTPNRGYSYHANVGYNQMLFPDTKWWINTNLTYGYEQQYRSNQQSLYRLDRLNDWGIDTDHSLGELPSTTEDLFQSMDRNNSFQANQMDFNHQVELYLQKTENLKSGASFQVKATLPVVFERKRLDYYRASLDTLFSRNNTLFNPRVEIGYYAKDWKYSIDLNYDSKMSSPSMTSLLDIRDDANPLYIRYGNPDLRNAWRHHVSLRFNKDNSQQQRSFNVYLNYSITENAVATGYIYNKQTGVRTTKPENVNGNWDANGTVNYNFSPDKAHRLSITTSTSATYYNSVDLMGVNDALASTRSTVQSFYLGENIRADYRINKLKVGAKFGGTW
ncbi:MAG: outer membrane beta-barrel protein, partial [Bacteroidaceae bacterium]